MSSLESIEGLSECISRAIQDHLERSNISVTWPHVDKLNHPVLRIEAFLEEAGSANATHSRSKRVASVRMIRILSCKPQADRHLADIGSDKDRDAVPIA